MCSKAVSLWVSQSAKPLFMFIASTLTVHFLEERASQSAYRLPDLANSNVDVELSLNLEISLRFTTWQ